MNIFSVISILACVIYMYIGVYAYNYERKSRLNQLFAALCTSMSIWSFAYAFVYITQEEQYIWMKISAIGWCTFSSLILHLVLLLTENRFISRKYIKVLIYVPSVLFFYISVFLFWKDSKPSKFIEDFFYIGDFIYHFSFLLLSIVLVAFWGSRSHSIRRRKQARIIVLSSITPFLLNLLTNDILPLFGIEMLPSMGHIYSLVVVIGAYYAMIKYRFLEITPKLLVDELLHEMVDVVILVSPDGCIARVNESTEKLLGYSSKELISRQLENIIEEKAVKNIIVDKQDYAIHKFSEIVCKKKDGGRTSLSMTCSLIIDPYIKDVLGMLIVGHDLSLVKELEKKIYEHQIAEEKISYMAYNDALTGLPNRKYFYETLSTALHYSNQASGKFAILFLDVDGLKNVNDNYGHEAGDFLICEVGRRAKASIGERDVVARIGGDEFTFLLFGIHSTEEAKLSAENIMESINKPIMINGIELMISTSIGVSIYPDDGAEVDVLVKRADNEMYKVKREKHQHLIA